jgi:hypothetical protein
MNKSFEEMDGFEKREACPNYWKDPRWKKVSKLRLKNKQAEANSLVMEIRRDWGME